MAETASPPRRPMQAPALSLVRAGIAARLALALAASAAVWVAILWSLSP